MRLFVLILLFASAIAANTQSAGSLTLRQTIPLPDVNGKFDHFTIDLAGNRLFAAVTGNHSVEVIDLKSNTVAQSIGGLGKPHGLVWVGATSSLYVADGTLGELQVYKGAPLVLAGKIKLSEDADDMVYDDAHHRLFVGHGGSNAANPARIAVVNTDNFTLVANLPVPTHPEALEIDPQSRRVFANIADSNEVAVIAPETQAISATWELTKAADNVPLAFDREHQMLFVGCRKPGMLIAIDAATGKEIGSAPAAGEGDDLFYDPALRNLYLVSGAGEIDTYHIDEARTLHSLGVVHTVPGAKTALLVPVQGLLYVGIPGTAGKSAEIRVFSTNTH